MTEKENKIDRQTDRQRQCVYVCLCAMPCTGGKMKMTRFVRCAFCELLKSSIYICSKLKWCTHKTHLKTPNTTTKTETGILKPDNYEQRKTMILKSFGRNGSCDIRHRHSQFIFQLTKQLSSGKHMVHGLRHEP